MEGYVFSIEDVYIMQQVMAISSLLFRDWSLINERRCAHMKLSHLVTRRFVVCSRRKSGRVLHMRGSYSPYLARIPFPTHTSFVHFSHHRCMLTNISQQNRYLLLVRLRLRFPSRPCPRSGLYHRAPRAFDSYAYLGTSDFDKWDLGR